MTALLGVGRPRHDQTPGRAADVSYRELGPTYCDGTHAPDSPRPWTGSLAHVRGLGLLQHLTSTATSRVVVLGEGGGAEHTIDLRPGAVVLPSATGSLAWVVQGGGEPILELSGAGGLRDAGLRAPELPVRSGLVLEDRTAVLVTTDGGLVHLGTGGPTPITFPARTPRAWSIAPAPGAGFLVTHRKGCSVSALTRSFEPVWRFGGVAGNAPDQLSGPEHAIAWQGGVLVADTRNSRLVRLDSRGVPTGVVGGGSVGSVDGLLSCPTSLCADDSGELLVNDAGNYRVLAYDRDLAVRRTLRGRPVVRSQLFHHPRSAEPLGESGILVADAYHDRVVSLDDRGRVARAWHEADGEAFAWPRHAVQLHGRLTIADSRNGRLVSAEDGHLRTTVLRDGAGARVVHADPHFIRPFAGGFLLSDTYANRVTAYDLAGRLVGAWGGEPHHTAVHTLLPGQVHIGVTDCHDGVLADDGRTLWMVDTGNHRVVVVRRDGGGVRTFGPDGGIFEDLPLSYPRSISILGGHVALADAGHHRVLVCEVATGRTVWSFGGSARGLSTRTLDDPRFVRLRRVRGATVLTVVDHGNHRVLEWTLRLPEPPA